jgi:threonine/homoserine/homoserine lactone efflux protein
MNRLIAFAVLSAVMVITPGPDSLLVLRNTLRGGRRDGFRTACGAAAGSLGWGLSSAAGLTAITVASAQLYRAVQLAGAGYLLFLGVQSWRAVRSPSPDVAGQVVTPGYRPGRGFAAGLVSDLLNPKVGLFFLAVIPQFIPRHAGMTWYALGYAAVDSVIALGWLTAVAWFASRAGHWIGRPRVRRALDRTVGAVLIGLGVEVTAKALPA